MPSQAQNQPPNRLRWINSECQYGPAVIQQGFVALDLRISLGSLSVTVMAGGGGEEHGTPSVTSGSRRPGYDDSVVLPASHGGCSCDHVPLLSSLPSSPRCGRPVKQRLWSQRDPANITRPLVCSGCILPASGMGSCPVLELLSDFLNKGGEALLLRLLPVLF